MHYVISDHSNPVKLPTKRDTIDRKLQVSPAISVLDKVDVFAKTQIGDTVNLATRISGFARARKFFFRKSIADNASNLIFYLAKE